MSRLEIILSAILTLSMIINIGIFVYARYAIVQLLSVSEELGDLQQMVNSFTEHLSSIYELESFNISTFGLKTLVVYATSYIDFNNFSIDYDFGQLKKYTGYTNSEYIYKDSQSSKVIREVIRF